MKYPSCQGQISDCLTELKNTWKIPHKTGFNVLFSRIYLSFEVLVLTSKSSLKGGIVSLAISLTKKFFYQVGTIYSLSIFQIHLCILTCKSSLEASIVITSDLICVMIISLVLVFVVPSWASYKSSVQDLGIWCRFLFIGFVARCRAISTRTGNKERLK